jgi:hypothetical protein
MVRRYRLLAAGTSFAAFSLAVMIACSDPEPTSFGNPNTLDRKNLPGEGGVEQLVCGADAAAEGGGFDGGCPSFATDIFPYFAPAGIWRCSDNACHGGPAAPPIVGANADGCLDSLKKITVKNIPYVLSDGGKDPNGHSLLCNLQGTCGSKMPKPPGIDPTNADLCKVEAWLKCGAPP